MHKTKCSKCGYEWEYKGKRRMISYITCPDCHAVTKLSTLIKNRQQKEHPNITTEFKTADALPQENQTKNNPQIKTKKRIRI